MYHLENAYKSLRENEPLIEAEEEALIDFVDRSVTCTLNPELAAKMIDVNYDKEHGLKIIEIVKACMIHYHTKACRKYGSAVACRFRFPKFPIWKTILTTYHVDEDDLEKRKERLDRHKLVLNLVVEILENTELIDSIMEEYDKENESIPEYRINRKERMLKVLEIVNVDPDDYVTALKESSRKGINVILDRDIDELHVNNYNPEWLEACDGNIDTQPCFDFFAVVTYITEYFTKDESGTSKFLAEASKQIQALPIKDQRRCIKNVFLTHRQMGLSEAYMKIFPDIKLKDSNITSVFVPLGRKEDISRYLLRADPELDYHDKELFEIFDREGLYYEKPNWIEKYLRRDMSEWNELCLPQYIKMYDPTNKGEKEDEDGRVDEETNGKQENENKTSYVEDEVEEDYNNEEPDICMGPEGDAVAASRFEKDKAKYGQEVKFHYLITETGEIGKALPNVMKLENAYPGEPKFLRKRKHPKSLRFYKVKRDLNPVRFFLHELMMYKSF